LSAGWYAVEVWLHPNDVGGNPSSSRQTFADASISGHGSLTGVLVCYS
jgi:hypothetical protein